MTIGLIGYGRFGQLAARFLSRQSNVLVYDVHSIRRRLPGNSLKVESLSVVASQKLVVLAVPISVLPSMLHEIRPLVTPGALVVDVCSVKLRPVQWMRSILPRHVHILGTHPLFGPDSTNRSLVNRKIVLCPVRIPDTLLQKVIRVLRKEGMDVSLMSPSRHDRMAAETLLLTQYVGRLVYWTGIRKWQGSTLHYGKLLDLVRVAERDSVELFRDMWIFNPYAGTVARKLDAARKRLRHELVVAGSIGEP